MPTGEHTKDPIWKAAQSERLKGNDNAHGKLKDPKVYEGKIFGVFKVTKYLKQSKSSRGSKRRDYHYEVECTTCGSRKEMTLYALQICAANTNSKRKNMTCKNCDSVLEAKRQAVAKGAPLREKMTECFIRNDKANSNNLSTGIKHMTARRLKSGALQYDVYVSFDKKQRSILRSTNFNKAKACADELNKIIKEGGKEAFYKWYGDERSK